MQEVEIIHSDSCEIVAKKAWPAYVIPGLAGAMGVGIARMWHGAFASIVAIISISAAVYGVLHVRSTIMYVDVDGVWVFQGVFPWNKRTFGVKWRDISEAIYYTGFLSWACRSWNIKIGHRFTKSSEIYLTNMTNGPASVGAINGIHLKLVRVSD